jgi:hypothetical protein
MTIPLQVGPVELDLVKVVILALLAGTSVLAVTRMAAVYHDGLRTSIPELWQGGRSGRELSRYSYQISIGFIVAYALPYSLATGIIIIHILLLSADMIGLWFRRAWQAVGVGVLYGAAVTIVVDVAVHGLQQLTGFAAGRELLFAPLAYVFPLLAAVAIATQYGLRWGALSALATLGAWRLADTALAGGDWVSALTPNGGAIALAIMTVALVVAAMRGPATDATPDLSAYDVGIARIRGNWPYLIVPAVLIAVAASMGWLAGEPAQLVMLAVGSPEAAAMVALFSAVAFVPLIGISGMVSGVWNQDGYPDWFLAAGYLLRNPLLAAIAGAGLIALEIVSLRRVGLFLATHPTVHGAGSAARDALDTVPTLSMLAGGVVASVALAGPFGAAVVVGAYALNDAKGRPVMPLAVPVFAYLAVALAAELTRSFGLA